MKSILFECQSILENVDYVWTRSCLKCRVMSHPVFPGTFPVLHWKTHDLGKLLVIGKLRQLVILQVRYELNFTAFRLPYVIGMNLAMMSVVSQWCPRMIEHVAPLAPRLYDAGVASKLCSSKWGTYPQFSVTPKFMDFIKLFSPVSPRAPLMVFRTLIRMMQGTTVWIPDKWGSLLSK